MTTEVSKGLKAGYVWVVFFHELKQGIISGVYDDGKYEVRIVDSAAETAITRSAGKQPAGCYLSGISGERIHQTKLDAARELAMRYTKLQCVLDHIMQEVDMCWDDADAILRLIEKFKTEERKIL